MDAMRITERKTCRVCESPLEELFSLGDFFLSDFITEGEQIYKAPLTLVRCTSPECGLVQLKHTVPTDILYRKYWYKSGLNPVITNDLKEIAEIAKKFMEVKDERDVIFDIGANDGTLLSFIGTDYYRIGCDPAFNLADEAKKHSDYFINDYWDKKKYPKFVPKAKIVTAIGMFYDMEDPGQFVRDAVAVMRDDGVFIAQFMTLQPMVESNDLGNICHEHLEFYSYKSLKKLFEMNGLEVFKIEQNSINGGSYRVFAKKFRKGSVPFAEREYTKDDFLAFFERLKQNRKNVNDFIAKAISQGKKVYGYGASTKGNTILQFYKLGPNFLKGIADRNEEKCGKRAVGTGIPVVSEEEARKDADVFFILPWGFRDFFLEREKEWREKGGVFITHTPTFDIL